MTGFEQIYRDYFQPVYRYIRRLSGDELLAEEITSETFFKAMKAAGKFRGEGELQAWLFRIARNCYFTHRKNARRQEPARPETLARLAGAEESPEEQLAFVRRQVQGVRRTLQQPAPARLFVHRNHLSPICMWGRGETCFLFCQPPSRRCQSGIWLACS